MFDRRFAQVEDWRRVLRFSGFVCSLLQLSVMTGLLGDVENLLCQSFIGNWPGGAWVVGHCVVWRILGKKITVWGISTQMKSKMVGRLAVWSLAKGSLRWLALWSDAVVKGGGVENEDEAIVDRRTEKKIEPRRVKKF